MAVIMTDRERYCIALMNTALRPAHALVVLAGEDWEPRINVARTFKVEHKSGQPVLITGGLEDPPQLRGAATMQTFLMGAGVDPEHIIVDDKAQNTREQAANAVALAVSEEWPVLMVIASPYHCYRAHLTFLRVLLDSALVEKIFVQMAPTANVPRVEVPWWQCPQGMADSRMELLEIELGKIDEYRNHVASYTEGLEYLKYWEGQ